MPQNRLLRNSRIAGISCIFALLFLADARSQGQPENFLAPLPAPERSVYASLLAPGAREVISLNGTWQVSRDGGDSWQQVMVPSSYNSIGSLKFRRSFTLTPEMLQKYRWKIVCYGVQYQTTISINDQFVGQHESGMPFSMMVPDEVKLGANNTIKVDVSNALDYTSTVPHRKLILGDRTYGGIFRDFILVGVPRVWIDDIRCETTSGAGGAAKLSVRISSGTIKGMTVGTGGDSAGTQQTLPSDHADFDLSVILRTPSGNDTIPSKDIARAASAFTLDSKRSANVNVSVPLANPTLWSPVAPYLYSVTVQVRYKGSLVDQQELKIGFRTFAVQGGAILLNGEPIQIKGVVYTEDSQQYGATLPYELMRKDLQAVKDMGGNLIRFVDGVPHPYLLQLCDELGIMAWIDAPIGTPPASLFSDDEYLRRALDRIRFVIEESSHFSSVCAYGLSAPIPAGSPSALQAVRRMRTLADSLDHRPFYFSATSWADAELRKLADIAGITTFDLEPARFRQMLQRSQKELAGAKPLVVLSYGKFVQLGNHNGYSDPISYESQAKYISDVYNAIAEANISGGIYWSFNDYRTDRPILSAYNDEQYLATSGLYGLDRSLRQGATMLTALYTNQKSPEVLIGDFKQPSTALFIIVGIACTIVFLLLVNNSRRFLEYVGRALRRPYNFFADIRDQRILSNVQTTMLGLIISATLAVIVSSLCFYYRMDSSFDAVLSAAVTSDGLKSFLDYIIWRPALSLISFTLLFFGGLLLTAGLIRGCAVFVRNRIFFNDAYVIAVWAALPVLFLVPVAIFLYRVLAVPGISFLAFLIMVCVFLWILYRVLRGTAVVYDVRPLYVYGYSLGGIAVIIAIMIVTSGNTRSTVSYLREGIGGWYQGG